MAVVGVDLGTTNSAVSRVNEKGDAEMLLYEGKESTPTVLSFTKKEGAVIGRAALEMMEKHPGSGFAALKRIVGESHDEALHYGLMDHLPEGKVFVESGRTLLSVTGQEKDAKPVMMVLAAFVQRWLGTITETYKIEDLEGLIVTVPAYFSNVQKVETARIFELAGYKVLRVTSEPAAAAFHILRQKGSKLDAGTYALLVDVGGGTTDVTVLQLKPGGDFHVVSTNGDMKLGGIDITRTVARTLLDLAVQEGFAEDDISEADLLRKAEAAKHALSAKDLVEVEFMTDNKPLTVLLRRSKMEDSAEIKDIVTRLTKCIEEIFERDISDGLGGYTRLTRSQIHKVLLMGGSCHNPFIVRAVQNLFQLRDEAFSAEDCDLACAKGAGRLAHFYENNINAQFVDSTAMPTYILTTSKDNRSVLSEIIPANATLRAENTKRFYFPEDGTDHVALSMFEGYGADVKAPGIKKVGTMEIEMTEGLRGEPMDIKIEITLDRLLEATVEHTDESGASVTQRRTLKRVGGYTEQEFQEIHDEFVTWAPKLFKDGEDSGSDSDSDSGSHASGPPGIEDDIDVLSEPRTGADLDSDSLVGSGSGSSDKEADESPKEGGEPSGKKMKLV